MSFKALKLVYKIIVALFYVGWAITVMTMAVGGGMLITGDIQIALDKDQIAGLVILTFTIQYSTMFLHRLNRVIEYFREKSGKKETS